MRFARRNAPRALPRGRVRARGALCPLDVYDTTWEDGRPVRVLATGPTLQSAIYLDEHTYDPVFEYYVLYDLMLEGPRPVHRALLLGGGGFAYPRYCLHAHAEVALDVVEADPKVIRLARRYFGLGKLEREMGRPPQGRLGVYRADARDFLAEHRGARRYDAILNDCFQGNVPAPALATVEAARLVRDRLFPGGLFLSNMVCALEGPRSELLRLVARTYREVFSHVYVVPGGRNPRHLDDNNLLVASMGAFDFPGAYELPLEGEGRILTDSNVLGRKPWSLR